MAIFLYNPHISISTMIIKSKPKLDKILHFLFNFGVVIIYGYAGIPDMGVILAILISGFKEIYDHQEGRFSIYDLIADIAGIVSGIIILILSQV